MTTTTSIDDEVKLYLHLADQIAQLTAQQKQIKGRIASLGIGEIPCSVAHVVVREPNRTFNTTKAADLLTPEQLDLCRVETYDAKRMKEFLPPVLLDTCMDPGKGDPVVVVKP